MRILFFCFIALLGSLGCKMSAEDFCRSNVYFRDVGKATNRASDIIAKRYGMTGMGGGLTAIALQGSKLLQEDEARTLLVGCVEIYLQELNANAALVAGYGREFDYRDIEVELFFDDAYTDRLYPPFVATADLSYGKAHYDYYTPEQRYGYGYSREESYPEAVELAKASKLAAPDRAVGETLTRIRSQLTPYLKAHQLELEGIGFSSDSLSIGLTINHVINVSQARALIVRASEELIAVMNADPYFKCGSEGCGRQNLDLALYSYQRPRRKFAPDWPFIPDVEFVALKGDTVTYGFLRRGPSWELKNYQTTEPYSASQEHLQQPDEPDPVEHFVADLQASGGESHE